MTKDEALTLALDVMERASHSLGSFVSDHGWGQEDMDTLDSVMAAEHRIREALAQTEPEPEPEPVLQDIEQYRMQIAGICTAAIGYWKEGDSIHPAYDTLALRDVAKLYAKYDALYKAPQRQPEERNFCERCGKRTADLTTIHTCTPPQGNT